MASERADVVVVGAGAAGAARRLAPGAIAGREVVCLEQGDWIDRADLASSRPEVETFLRGGPPSFSPNTRRLPAGLSGLDRRARAGPDLMFNGVGGSTIHWEGHFPRFHPSDFRVRSLDGVAADWPHHATRTSSATTTSTTGMIGVSGLAGDPANPPRAPRPDILRSASGSAGVAVARGFEKLGWHWWPSDNAILSRDSDGRRGCDARGRCNFGCPRKAKASVDITYWPKALPPASCSAPGRASARSRSTPRGRARGRALPRPIGRAPRAARARRRRLRQRHRDAAAAPALAVAALPERARQLERARRPELHGPSRAAYVEGVFAERIDGHVGITSNPCFSQEFYETDAAPRLRARLLARGLRSVRAALSQAWGDARARPLGRGAPPRDAAAFRAHGRHRGHVRGPAGGVEPGRRSTRADQRPPRHAGREGDVPVRREHPGCSTHGTAHARQVFEAAGPCEIREAPEPERLRAPHGHGAHGERSDDLAWWTPGTAPTTCRTSTSWTAAPSSRAPP